jgi:hypothetical protein
MDPDGTEVTEDVYEKLLQGVFVAPLARLLAD